MKIDMNELKSLSDASHELLIDQSHENIERLLKICLQFVIKYDYSAYLRKNAGFSETAQAAFKAVGDMS